MKKLIFLIIVFDFLKIGANAQNTYYSENASDINFQNFKKEILQDYALLPFTENFDSAWVNKLDSNDAPSMYWMNTPPFGNMSWRRNDMGATTTWTNQLTGSYTPAGAESTAHSARFHSSASSGNQGSLKAYLDFSTPGIKILKYWYINNGGNDSIAIYLSSDGGYTFDFYKKITDTVSSWVEDSVIMGISNSNTSVIEFRATSDSSSSDIGIDNVEVYIQQTVSINNTDITEPKVKIFPNPTNDGIVNIIINGLSKAQIAIYTIHGQMVHPENIISINTAKQLDLSYLSDGIYIIKISDNMNSVFRKIVIKR